MDTRRGARPPPRQSPPSNSRLSPKRETSWGRNYWRAATTAGGVALASACLIGALTISELPTFQGLATLAALFLLGDVWLVTPFGAATKALMTFAVLLLLMAFYQHAKPQKLLLDYKIALSCSHFGDALPNAEAKPHLVLVWGVLPKGFGRRFGAEGTHLTTSRDIRPRGSFAGNIVKCSFTNFSGIPVLNVRAQMDISFFEPLAGLQGLATAGKQQAFQPGFVDIGNIGSTPEQAAVLYFLNFGPSVTMVSKPDLVQLIRAGQTEKENVKILQSEPLSDTSMDPPAEPFTGLPGALIPALGPLQHP